tara:strand:- start:1724 stop:2704 length:981 start_codon:yes stop_codon:yes gene_type:complete
MKIAFVTEMGFQGKIPDTHENMRTEFAWMYAMNADHHCIHQYQTIQGYDHVFIIFPKGKLNLNAEGSKIANQTNPSSLLLQSDLIIKLKEQNKKVYYVQEGPSWWFNDYDVQDQILFYNMLASVDAIYAHNQHDISFYQGLVPKQIIRLITTLMIDTHIKDIVAEPQDKVLIGGNFSRWYNGFQSYIVASEFNLPIWVQESHSKRENEDHIDNLNHFPRMMWNHWMQEVSKFKYAVHLMPTIAAGTFSLNCAYFGIPCIGNKNVDTQRLCHPDLSIDVDDIGAARKLAIQLRDDKDFYSLCSKQSKIYYKQFYGIESWKKMMYNTL